MIEYLEHDSPRTGKKIKYRVDVDARQFQGRAGMPWIIMAANVDMSINNLLEVMAAHGYERTRGWVERRRWIFIDARLCTSVRRISRCGWTAIPCVPCHGPASERFS